MHPVQCVWDWRVPLWSPFRDKTRLGTSQDPCDTGPQDSSGAQGGAGSAHQKTVRLSGSHSWEDIGAPLLLLLLQGKGHECTPHRAPETKGGTQHIARRIRGHGEHVVNVSSSNIHKTLLALCKNCPQPHVSLYSCQAGPETGPSVLLGSPTLCRTAQGDMPPPSALLVYYTRNDTYRNTQHYPALACPQHGTIAGPFHHGLISWQYCYTKCISEETKDQRG